MATASYVSWLIWLGQVTPTLRMRRLVMLYRWKRFSGQLLWKGSPARLRRVAQGIINDASCPGNYVMGTVVNKDGAPLAGIRLEMTDQWGNRTYAMSKNGQNDYGMFDFPIYGDGPQNLQLAVVDANNNPIGAPVIVPHKMDAASDAPCQHVMIRGE